MISRSLIVRLEILLCAVLGAALAVFVGGSLTFADDQSSASKSTTAKNAEPWSEVPAAESTLPDVEPAELLKRFEAVLEEWRSMPKGSVHYAVQPAGKMSRTYGWAVFEPYEQTFAWNGERWRLEWTRRRGEGEDALEFRATVVSDGKTMRALHENPGSTALLIRSANEKGGVPQMVLWSALPSAPDGLAGTAVGSKVPAEGELRVIPARVQIDGHEFYQFERFVETVGKPTQTVLPKDPTDFSKGFQLKDPGDPSKGYKMVDAVRTDRSILRIAVDPDTLRPVAWAIGIETRYAFEGRPPEGEPYRNFPRVTAHLTDYRQVGECAVPWSVEVTEYFQTPDRKMKVGSRTRLTVKEWTTDPPQDSGFARTVPEGTPVLDNVRRIGYDKGATQEEIDRLLAGATKRNRYYKKLKSQPPPELRGQWIAGPIRSGDLKGKYVRLYLWSLGCGPCAANLPKFEQIYGENGSRSDEIFFAVHRHVGADRIEDIRKFVREKGLTFPILVDAAGSFDGSPGRLHEYFRSAVWPTQIQYGPDGQYIRSSIDRRVLSLQGPLNERWWGE